MNKRYAHYALAVFFLVLVILKIGIVSSVAFPDYDAFFGIRQVEHIHENFVPIIADDLSYQGRQQVNSLFFYVVIALFAILIPTVFIFKYASILIGILVLFFLYKIVESIFNNRVIALFITLLAGLSPSLFSAHLNTLTPSSFFIILYVLLVYSFIHLEKHSSTFIALLVIAVLSSPLSLVFVLGLLFYVIIIKIESMPLKPQEFEIFIFTIVFSLWYHVIIYKSLLLDAGVSAISQTVPQEVLLSSFQNFTPALAVVFIGILPLILGMYGTYAALFEQRQRKLLFVIGQLIAFGGALWSGIVPVQEGLLYVTLAMLILSGYTLQRANTVFRKTVIPRVRIIALIGLVVIVCASFLPTLVLDRDVFVDAPTQEELTLLGQVRNTIPEESTVLGHIQDGHLITAVANRRNFYDQNYLLAPNVEQRYNDARKMFLSRSTSTVLSLAQLYGIDYIYFTDTLNASIPSTPLFTQGNCFTPVLQEGTTILYEITCQLE